MKISIRMISLKSHKLFFLFDNDHQPIIEVEDVPYRSLKDLLDTFPELGAKNNLGTLAQIANFLARGMEFQNIEDIEAYKEFYCQQIESEKASSLYEGSTFRDYGLFDLSVIHPPCLKNHQLIFYVKDEYLNIPYQATLNYPIQHDHPEIVYELLPYDCYR